MTIERVLGRLVPRQERVPNDSHAPPAGVAAPATLEIPGSGNADDHRIEQGVMRSTGAASLDTGNDYGGLPQAVPEFRGVGETAINAGDLGYPTEGNIAFDLADANVFYIELTDDATISFNVSNWPLNAYNRGVAAGVDISCSVVIEKGATELNIVCDHWAPDDNPPDLSGAGFYEIGFAVMIIGSMTIVRGFPAIKPE